MAKKYEQQMEMFEDGGLKDEGGTTDPISGNDVPVGSTQEEVRDDIPAQLSEGEFVFPADVTRYIGLENLMQLRQKAKSGLAKMDAMGQMGNSEEAVISDDGDYDAEIDQMIDELDAPDAVLAIGIGPPPERPVEMAVGGLAGTQPGQQVGGFLPAGVGTVNAQQMQQAPTFGGIGAPPTYESKAYIGPEGDIRYFTLINGTPTTPIPEGYEPYDPATAPVVDAPTVTAPTVTAPDGGDGGDNGINQAPMERTRANDYGMIDDRTKNIISAGAGVLGGPILGGIARGGVNLSNAQAVNAARADLGLEPLSTEQFLSSAVTAEYSNVAGLDKSITFDDETEMLRSAGADQATLNQRALQREQLASQGYKPNEPFLGVDPASIPRQTPGQVPVTDLTQPAGTFSTRRAPTTATTEVQPGTRVNAAGIPVTEVTLPSGALSGQPAAAAAPSTGAMTEDYSPSIRTPAQQATIDQQMANIAAYDQEMARRDSVIQEQQSNIAAYDAEMARRGAVTQQQQLNIAAYDAEQNRLTAQSRLNEATSAYTNATADVANVVNQVGEEYARITNPELFSRMDAQKARLDANKTAYEQAVNQVYEATSLANMPAETRSRVEAYDAEMDRRDQALRDSTVGVMAARPGQAYSPAPTRQNAYGVASPTFDAFDSSGQYVSDAISDFTSAPSAPDPLEGANVTSSQISKAEADIKAGNPNVESVQVTSVDPKGNVNLDIDGDGKPDRRTSKNPQTGQVNTYNFNIDTTNESDGGSDYDTSSYGSQDEADAVANDGWGSDAHFDAIDDQFDDNTSSGGGGGGNERWCCSRMVHHELWTVEREFARLSAWSRKQPDWWRSGYNVWGKVVAKHLLGKQGFWTDVMQAFYDNHVMKKPRTLKSTLADVIIFPGSFICGHIWKDIPGQPRLADPKEFV